MKKFSVICVLAVFLFSLSGCATARRQGNLEAQGLRNQISVLEEQLKLKDDEIYALQEALSQSQAKTAAKQAAGKKSVGEVKSRPKTKQIQIALSNAGFNPGPLDGKMGKQTRSAVKAFQRANGLSVDGKVGKQTWKLLSGYLYKKTK